MDKPLENNLNDAVQGKRNMNVINECNLSMSETFPHTDLTVNFSLGEGGRGSKRILNERVDSPSKKLRNRNKFQTLLTFWGGPQGRVATIEPESGTSFKNATQPTGNDMESLTKTYTMNTSVDLKLNASMKSKSDQENDPTYGGD